MSKTKNILVVEDDPDVRGALVAFLEGEGYTVVEAMHGAEALEHLRNSAQFCMILLDLMMPVMNGWEFREHQRKDPAFAEIPVLVVTADTTAVRRAADVGAVGCLLKPVEFPELLDYVGRYC